MSNGAKDSKFKDQFMASFSYALCSMLILISNKKILSTYEFKYPNIMTLAHMLTCVVFLLILRAAGAITFPDITLATAKKVLPLTLCFVLNVVISVMALSLVNIPMFTTLRRLTTLFTFLTQWYVNRVAPDTKTCYAIGLMMLGALIAGAGDLAFDPLGYFLVLVNNIFTAAYLSLIKKVSRETNLGGSEESFGVVYYNAVLSTPLLLAFAVFSGEFDTIGEFKHLHNTDFQIYFFFSALMAFGINYATFWCTNVNSPLTTSVTGQAKNVVTNIVSLILFPISATFALISGLCIGLLGSFYYAYVKYQQGQANRAPVGAMPLKNLDKGNEESLSSAPGLQAVVVTNTTAPRSGHRGNE